MNFGWTDAQHALWERTVRFAEEQLHDDVIARDQSGTFPRALWEQIARQGLLGLFIPERFGGGGCDMVTTIHALEALGYGCADNGLTLAVNGQMWAVQEPILRFGSEAQIARYMPGLIDGTRIGAHGMTERATGSNAFALSTTAARVDGGYLLNGEKVYIGMAPVADLLLIFAATDPARGRWGLTAFLVEADSPGVTRSEAQSKLGVRTNPMGTVTLRDVFVAEDGRLGREGAGAAVFSASMEYERSFIFASHVGAMARQLERAVGYARSRNTGQGTIDRYQSVSNRLADMKVRLETARYFLYRAAWQIDQQRDATLEAAMAKLVISEAFLQNSEDAIRIHGGRGYLTAESIERDFRDAMGGVIYSGTSDIQRNLIAALLKD